MSSGGPRKWINKEMFSVDTPTFLKIELKYANLNLLLSLITTQLKYSFLKGHRAPYLQSGGDAMFQALKNLNMTYDSTMPTSAMSPPIWPFTLDYGVTHVLRIITFFR